MKKQIDVPIVIVLVVFGILTLCHFINISQCDSLQGTATGIVNDIAVSTVYERTGTRNEYKLFYVYYVKDEPYIGESDWISAGSDVHTGQEVGVKYDLDRPGSSMLELEKDNSITWIISMSITVMIIAGIAVYAKVKR